MTSDRTPGLGETGQAPVAMEAVDMLWQLNIAAFTGWWNHMAVPCLHEHSRLPHLSAHEQPIVPEPLEDTAEMALLA